MEDDPNIPKLSQPLLERLLIRLTNTIRTHTNATLRVEQQLSAVTGKLDVLITRTDHLLQAEIAESADVREVRALLLEIKESSSESKFNLREMKKDVEDISTGKHILPSQAEIEAYDRAHKKPGVIEAFAVIYEKASALPWWAKLSASITSGGGIMHLLHKWLHF